MLLRCQTCHSHIYAKANEGFNNLLAFSFNYSMEWKIVYKLPLKDVPKVFCPAFYNRLYA